MKRILLLASVVLLSHLSLSQIQPEFVKNLTFPGNFIDLNGEVFFKCSGGDMGLWKTDGTSAGTVQVMSFIGIDKMYKFNNTLFFMADDGINGAELWKSDGTAAGTQLVKNINPTGNMMDLNDVWMFVAGNNEFFFTADDGVHGRELWKSDGTEAGTVLVKDINPGAASSEPQHGYFFNNELYFDADEPSVSRELFKSDGTELGTELVMDLYVEASGNCGCPRTFFEWNNELYFTSQTTASTPFQNGIFKITTSSSTPQLIHEPRTRPNFFYPYQNSLYFTSGVNSTTDYELFKTDGTTAGTVMVDINPNGPSSLHSFYTFNGEMYFNGVYDTGVNGMMKSDGTVSGTSLVKQGVSATSHFLLDGVLHFLGADVTQTEIWKTDGTDAGTVMAYDINPGPSSSYINPITPVLDKIYFRVGGGTQQGLWKFDLSSLGLNNNEKKSLGIYPNPASTVINVEMANASTVRMFDISGKLLKELNGSSNYTIDVTDLTPGMYMIESAEGAKAKFVKQ
jgi:trimeric autotransporter adhesin